MIRKLMTILLSITICLLGLTSALAAKYNEVPMLKTRVAAGELPPVEERLPEKPVVVEPLEQIGQYGGTVHIFSTRPEHVGDGEEITGWENLFRPSPDYKTIVPNIAKDCEFSKDGKTFTVHLRKGIKWSDGVPFTADDIMFWYEDIFLNDELTPFKDKNWCPGDKPVVVEKVNDYAIRFHFAVSYPTVKLMLAHTYSVFAPKHYLKGFHSRYTSLEKLNEITKEEGFDFWYQLFGYKNRRSYSIPLNPDRPTLIAFVLKERRPTGYALERNPYYWKVDTEGNQLPYIDKIDITIVTDPEVLHAKIVTGEADFAARFTGMENYTLYKENVKKGNYRVLLWKSTWGAEADYGFNQTYNEDPVLRDIFRDVRFRRALSLAIDREEINDILYHGLAEPRQMTVLPVSCYYEEEFARSYAKYDPDEANRLLDEMRLDKRDKEGYRLRSDGKRLTFTIEIRPGEASRIAVTELVVSYWKSIGVQAILKTISAELADIHSRSNKLQVGGGGAGDNTTDIMFVLCPYWCVPMNYGWETCWETLWGQWYLSGGKAGEEPPAEMKRLLNLWEKMKTTMGEEERVHLGKEILRAQAENLWTIGTVGCSPYPIIVRDNLRNFPEKGYWGWDFLRAYPSHPEQFFLKRPLLKSQKD